MKRSCVHVALALAVVLAAGTARAQALDQASTDALNDTLLALRAEGTRGGPVPGVAPDSDLGRALHDSPELTRELYDVAGDAFREMAASNGGDAERMSGMVERGRTDPAAFADSLSPATRERLRALAQKIEAR